MSTDFENRLEIPEEPVEARDWPVDAGPVEALHQRLTSERDEEILRLRTTLNASVSRRSWRMTAPLRMYAKVRRESAVHRMVRSYERKTPRDGRLIFRSVEDLRPSAPSELPRVCAIVHAFYIELLPEIAAHLERCSSLCSVIVSHPIDIPEDLVHRALSEFKVRGITVETVAVENRGRDFLPFLQVLPRALATDCEVFLKLHTKKSPHLPVEEGEAWRRRILNGLLPPGRSLDDLVAIIGGFPSFGFAAPESTIAGRESWGRNRRKVRKILKRAGIRAGRDLVFPAGSMFWFGRGLGSAFVNLDVRPEEFEEERGQLDGTTAHALERSVHFLLPSSQSWAIRKSR